MVKKERWNVLKYLVLFILVVSLIVYFVSVNSVSKSGFEKSVTGRCLK